MLQGHHTTLGLHLQPFTHPGMCTQTSVPISDQQGSRPAKLSIFIQCVYMHIKVEYLMMCYI